MAKNKIKRPGSGRTDGATTFVSVTLEQLNKHFSNPQTPIKVRRLWAEEVGLTGTVIAEPAAPNKVEAESAAPQVKVTSFDS